MFSTGSAFSAPALASSTAFDGTRTTLLACLQGGTSVPDLVAQGTMARVSGPRPGHSEARLGALRGVANSSFRRWRFTSWPLPAVQVQASGYRRHLRIRPGRVTRCHPRLTPPNGAAVQPNVPGCGSRQPSLPAMLSASHTKPHPPRIRERRLEYSCVAIWRPHPNLTRRRCFNLALHACCVRHPHAVSWRRQRQARPGLHLLFESTLSDSALPRQKR